MSDADPEGAAPDAAQAPAPGQPPWLQALIAASVLLTPPLLGGAAWFTGVLLMAFAGDAGLDDEAGAQRAFHVFTAGMGLFAACGMPGALAVLIPPLRKPMIRLCLLASCLGVIGGAVGVALFVFAL